MTNLLDEKDDYLEERIESIARRIRAKEQLSDPQVFLIRNIVLSSAGLLGALLFDVGRAGLFYFGLALTFPVFDFGIFQFGAAIFFGAFLALSLNDWKYYKP